MKNLTKYPPPTHKLTRRLHRLWLASGMTQRQLRDALAQRGCDVSVWTLDSWLNANRKPNRYVTPLLEAALAKLCLRKTRTPRSRRAFEDGRLRR